MKKEGFKKIIKFIDKVDLSNFDNRISESYNLSGEYFMTYDNIDLRCSYDFGMGFKNNWKITLNGEVIYLKFLQKRIIIKKVKNKIKKHSILKKADKEKKEIKMIDSVLEKIDNYEKKNKNLTGGLSISEEDGKLTLM
jgi:hypothetical protein